MLGHAKIRPEFNFCSVMTKRPIYVGKCHVHKLSLLRHCVTDEIEIRQQWRRADRFANLLTRSVVKNIDGGSGFHHHLSLPEFFSSRVFDRSQVLDFTVLLDLCI
ncbi:hypothetical protein Peur_069521 [Populus x canadensis]